MTRADRNADQAAIAEALRRADSVLVLSHMRPDGDAIGSQLALGHSLSRLGKSVEMWNHDAVPGKLRFLPGAERIDRPPGSPGEVDVVVAVDTSDRRRLGDCAGSVGGSPLWINIDHHGTNERYGDLNLVEPDTPAAGQILYELIRSQELPFSYEVADCLFVAISTDTGSFQYPNTTARTFEIGAELVRAGVNVGDISGRIYESYPLRRIELLRSLLNSLELLCDGQVAVTTLPRREAERIGSRPEDTEGLIDHIRSIDTVRVAVFIEETETGEIRASLRSKSETVNVAAICKGFGGGGHPLAAGVRLDMPLAEAREKLIAAVALAVGAPAQSDGEGQS